MVTSAVYTFPASPTPASSGPPPTDAAQALPVHLLFAKEVNSKTAEIGDKIPLTLADDVVVNGAVVARKGEPASVTIIQVDKTGVAGAPGNLEFQIDRLQTDFGILNFAARPHCKVRRLRQTLPCLSRSWGYLRCFIRATMRSSNPARRSPPIWIQLPSNN